MNDSSYGKKYYADNKKELSLKAKRKYLENRKEILHKAKKYTEANKEHKKEYDRIYNLKNREKKKLQNALWNQNNKGWVSARHAERHKTDINYRLSNVLRKRISKIVSGHTKSGSAVADLGCSIEQFKIHIESLFQLGMTWENYGKWHIDHKYPLSRFDLSKREDFLKACNYTNLQPLWAVDNLRKGNKIV